MNSPLHRVEPPHKTMRPPARQLPLHQAQLLQALHPYQLPLPLRLLWKSCSNNSCILIWRQSEIRDSRSRSPGNARSRLDSPTCIMVNPTWIAINFASSVKTILKPPGPLIITAPCSEPPSFVGVSALVGPSISDDTCSRRGQRSPYSGRNSKPSCNRSLETPGPL